MKVQWSLEQPLIHQIFGVLFHSFLQGGLECLQAAREIIGFLGMECCPLRLGSVKTSSRALDKLYYHISISSRPSPCRNPRLASSNTSDAPLMSQCPQIRIHPPPTRARSRHGFLAPSM